MVDHNLTVRIVDKISKQPLSLTLIVDDQPIDFPAPSFTITLLEGTHILQTPEPAPGTNLWSVLWSDKSGNILSQNPQLTLNLTADQEITLTVAYGGVLPPKVSIVLLLLVLGGIGTCVYLGYRIIKKYS